MQNKISWLQLTVDGETIPSATINPIIGCSKIGQGCLNCYAEKMANRLAYNFGHYYYQRTIDGKTWSGNLVYLPKVMDTVLKKKRPTLYFVGSMTDMFHDNVEPYWLDDVMEAICATPQHYYIMLTKRPGNIREKLWKQFPWRERTLKAGDYPKNLMIGVSVSTHEEADKCIPELMEAYPGPKCVSIEPMISGVNIERWLFVSGIDGEKAPRNYPDKLNMIICGGESGPGARPMHPDWVRSLRDQCSEAFTAFHFKQWAGVSKKNHVAVIDGVVHKQFPKCIVDHFREHQ